MDLKGIIVLSLFVAHSLSAPSGCIESCITYRGSHRVPNGYQQQAALTQSTNILQNLDFSRPGNWTEQNQYKTDGGHGNVYEEQGQFVEGGKTVRYYKQNYSSSYSSGQVNGGLSRLGEQMNNYRQNVLHGGQQHLDTQSAYDQSQSSHSIRQQQEYNRIYNQLAQSSSRDINRQSERLEDLGEHSENSRVSTYGTTDTRPQNWHKENTYKTDNGHGRVYEEEGQFVTGPKTVKYYRRNYTSSYSSGAVPTVPIIQVPNLQKEIDRIHKQFDSYGREIHQQSTSEHVLHNQGGSLDREDLQVAETDHYGTQNHHQNVAVDISNPVVSTIRIRPVQTVHNTEHQSSYEKHEKLYTSSNGHPTSYMPMGVNSEYNMNQQNMHNSQLQQSHLVSDNVKSNMYNQNSGYYQSRPSQTQNYEEHWHASGYKKHNSVPSSDLVHTSGYNTNGYGTGHADYQTAQHVGSLHTHAAQSAAHTASSGSLVTGVLDLGHGMHTVDCDHGASEQVHYESQYRRKYKRGTKFNEQDDLQQKSSGFDDLTQQSEDLTQQSEDLTQQSEDLTQQNMDHTQHDKDFTQQSEDLTQQTQGKLEFGQQTQQHHYPNQQTSNPHKLTQQNQDDTQHSLGKLEFGQQTQQDHSQQSEDLTQQTLGKLEFGQQTQQDHSHQSEDLTQQSLGKLEFGHHPQRDDSQQSEDLTQQSLGKLEFGQQTQQDHSHQSEDLTQQSLGKLEFGQHPQQDDSQQSEDLSQQSLGKLEFGQHPQRDHSQQSEDLTQQSLGKLEFGHHPQQDDSQQSEDLTQQSLGKLELGQHPQRDHSQQSEDLTQQSLGKLEFGEQTQQDHSQQSEDLTQQSLGKLEFGQHPQHDHSQQSEDLTQQSLGKLEFGEQTQQDHSQQSEDLTQQSLGKLEFGRHAQQDHSQQSEDLTQQSLGKLEFGEQTQRDHSQQSEDLTQQSLGKLEFGQHAQQVNNQQNEDFTQQSESHFQHNEDLTQQTEGRFEFGHKPHSRHHTRHTTNNHNSNTDLTQTTLGKLEFGQHTQYPVSTSAEDLNHINQQNQGQTLQHMGKFEFDQSQQVHHDKDVTQQSMGKIEFGQYTQYPYYPKQSIATDDYTQQNEDLTQQTIGKLEFGQHVQEPYKLKKTDSEEHMQDFSQQNEDLTQQTGGFDFTQHPTGKLELGQKLEHPEHPIRLNEPFQGYPKPSEDSSQHTRGQLQFGQIQQSNGWPYEKPVGNNKYLDKLPQENEDFTQQAEHEFDDDSQRRGRLNFEEQSQQGVRPERISISYPWQDSFPHNNEELTQQTRDRLTQHSQHQSHDHWFNHAQHPQYPHDNTQQAVSHIGDENAHNQLSQEPGAWQQETFPQQSDDNPPGVLPLENERGDTNNHEQQPGSFTQKVQSNGEVNHREYPPSAPKPRPRPRYNRVGSVSVTEPSSTTTEKTDDQSKEQDHQIIKGDTNVDSIQEPVEITPEANIIEKTEDLVREQVLENKNQNKDDARELHQQTQGGGFDLEKGNVDQVHRLHKSNDATIGLQWHYTYHPSDLTNSEPLHGSFYPTLNYNSMGQQTQMHQQSMAGSMNQEDSRDMQQQSSPFDSDLQQTQDQTRFGNMYQQSSNMRPHTLHHIPLYRQEYSNTYRFPQQPNNVQHHESYYDNSDQQLGSFQQSQDSEFGQQVPINQETKETQKHIGRLEFGQIKERLQEGETGSTTEAPIYKIEPRILEAYGGGPYDGTNNDEIYRRVPPNPSVTLPPIGGADPWDIHEKPKEVPTTILEIEIPSETTNTIETTNEPTDYSTDATESTSEPTPPPSFWGRLGNKITSTFDKAREKARGIFG